MSRGVSGLVGGVAVFVVVLLCLLSHHCGRGSAADACRAAGAFEHMERGYECAPIERGAEP